MSEVDFMPGLENVDFNKNENGTNRVGCRTKVYIAVPGRDVKTLWTEPVLLNLVPVLVTWVPILLLVAHR